MLQNKRITIFRIQHFKLQITTFHCLQKQYPVRLGIISEKLAFCTTTTKEGSKLIDENTLTFVALHEISHIATKSIGHKKEFWENFKFILQNAVNLGIYKPDDYKKKPKKYCGMTITDNPYYDL